MSVIDSYVLNADCGRYTVALLVKGALVCVDETVGVKGETMDENNTSPDAANETNEDNTKRNDDDSTQQTRDFEKQDGVTEHPADNTSTLLTSAESGNCRETTGVIRRDEACVNFDGDVPEIAQAVDKVAADRHTDSSAAETDVRNKQDDAGATENWRENAGNAEGREECRNVVDEEGWCTEREESKASQNAAVITSDASLAVDDDDDMNIQELHGVAKAEDDPSGPEKCKQEGAALLANRSREHDDGAREKSGEKHVETDENESPPVAEVAAEGCSGQEEIGSLDLTSGVRDDKTTEQQLPDNETCSGENNNSASNNRTDSRNTTYCETQQSDIAEAQTVIGHSTDSDCGFTEGEEAGKLTKTAESVDAKMRQERRDAETYDQGSKRLGSEVLESLQERSAGGEIVETQFQRTALSVNDATEGTTVASVKSRNRQDEQPIDRSYLQRDASATETSEMCGPDTSSYAPEITATEHEAKYAFSARQNDESTATAQSSVTPDSK